jgi:hypothetical protein
MAIWIRMTWLQKAKKMSRPLLHQVGQWWHSGKTYDTQSYGQGFESCHCHQERDIKLKNVL